MKLICDATGVTVEATKEVADSLAGKGFTPVESAAKPVEKMKKDELVAYAEENGIDISDAKTVADILEAIKEAE